MTKKAELMFIPSPGMDHLVSTVQLAKVLVQLNSNLSITILTIKPPYDAKACAYIDSLSAGETSTTVSRIKFIIHPHPDPDVKLFQFLSSLIQTLGQHVREAATKIIELSNSVPDSPRLAGFVLDLSLSPMINWLNEFGVPSYAFSTSGASSLGFLLHMKALHDDQNVEILKLKDWETEFTIPSYVNPVSTKFFPSIMFSPKSVDFILRMVTALREAKGVLINTFSELESHAVDSLSIGKLPIPPIYPVGPLLDLAGPSETRRNHDTVMQWMDEQPPSSVVFLCFGSLGSLDVEQVTEIANALEQSGHRFLWSLRRSGEQENGMIRILPTDYENVAELFPGGFLDRTAGIGKVIGWAPQVAILSHPVTGGFVSHCGWNSTLESIWFGEPTAVSNI